jgi:S1-C subfamily serine protease
MLQRSVKRATYIGIAVLVLLLIVTGLVLALVLTRGGSSSKTAGSAAATSAVTTQPTAASAVQKVIPSTVLVVESEGGGNGGRGTGWVWDARQGLIVTNAHVTHGGVVFTINQGRSIDIREDSAGNLFAGPGARRAQLKGEALCEDIAVLQVSDRHALRTIQQLPAGKQLEIGDPVVAVGYPAAAPIAANPDFNATLTGNTGIVSVPKTTLEAVRGSGFETGPYQDVIQTDTVINEGNSGGPLVNFQGQLVGMNTVKSTQNVGQNYAIADERIRQIVPELIAGKDPCHG